jgi:hypothetical protein
VTIWSNKLSLIDDELVGGHGIELLENGGGDLTAEVSNSNSSGNEGSVSLATAAAR